jgi:hypothetical protein
MSRTLLAGTGRADITPAPGVPQGGWGAQAHQRGLGAVEPAAPELRKFSRVIELPLKAFPPPEQLEAEAEALRSELNRLRAEGTHEQVRAATARTTQAGARAQNVRLYYGKRAIDWRIQAIRIGDVALVSIQGEPFNEISRRVMAGSPFAAQAARILQDLAAAACAA